MSYIVVISSLITKISQKVLHTAFARLRLLAITCFLCGFILVNSAQAEKMYVFVPTSLAPESIESSLQSSCPGINFQVFDRFRTFVNQVNQDKPDSVLTLLPTLAQNFGYDTVLTGDIEGTAEEPYVLVTLHEKTDINQLTDKTIGAVDILGRKSMKQYISGLLQTKVFVKRASKTEDLLMLLIYGSADAVFMSENNFHKMKAKSEANLIAVPTKIRVGVVGTAFRGDVADKTNILECITKLPKKVNSLLGIKAWRKV